MSHTGGAGLRLEQAVCGAHTVGGVGGLHCMAPAPAPAPAPTPTLILTLTLTLILTLLARTCRSSS